MKSHLLKVAPLFSVIGAASCGHTGWEREPVAYFEVWPSATQTPVSARCQEQGIAIRRALVGGPICKSGLYDRELDYIESCAGDADGLVFTRRLISRNAAACIGMHAADPDLQCKNARNEIARAIMQATERCTPSTSAVLDEHLKCMDKTCDALGLARTSALREQINDFGAKAEKFAAKICKVQ